jgi:hypothetical protein
MPIAVESQSVIAEGSSDTSRSRHPVYLKRYSKYRPLFELRYYRRLHKVGLSRRFDFSSAQSFQTALLVWPAPKGLLFLGEFVFRA